MGFLSSYIITIEEKLFFLKGVLNMMAFLTTITILSMSICGPNETVIVENLEIEKVSNTKTNKKIIFKKIPTKWTKITKKSI